MFRKVKKALRLRLRFPRIRPPKINFYKVKRLLGSLIRLPHLPRRRKLKNNISKSRRFLFTTFIAFLFTINFSGINLWFSPLARSEGSYQFGTSPTTTLNQQALFEYDALYNDSGGTTTNIGALKRPIYVDIKSANEKINISACGNLFTDQWKVDIYYVGAQPPTDNNSYTGAYSAYPPSSGSLFYTGGTNANGTIGTSANNPNCNNNSQLTSGTMTYPVSVSATSGPGVYEIRLQNLTQNTPSSGSNTTVFRQFDISVTNPTSPTTKIPASPNPQIAQGRVWSYVWAFNGGGFGVANSTNQDYYVVVPGGSPGTNFVWKLDLNQFAGFVYELVANNRGVNSPNAAGTNVRGLSVPISGNSVSPQYRMYVSYPDQTFVRPTQGPTISNLRFVDSAGEDNTFTPGGTSGIQDTGSFKFTASLPGTYQIIIDANQDGIYGTGDVQLRGDTDAVGNVSALWNGTTNTGATLPVGTYNAQVKAIVGEYHFIAGDVETSGPSVGLTIDEALSSSSTSSTPVYWDDKTILGPSGTTTLPDGTVAGRHTWGSTSSGGAQGTNGASWGDLTYLDTFVYGTFKIGNITAIIANGDDNDYGDAPDTYGTDKTNSGTEGIGASEIVSTTILLGTNATDVDTPDGLPVSNTNLADGHPSVNADGDDILTTDDEDAVTSFNTLVNNATDYTVTIKAKNTSGANAYLGGWIDFNRDGKFTASEGVVQTIPTGTNGNVNINWTGLSGLVAGTTYARFRINNNPLTTSASIGGGRDGEIEDYKLSIIPNIDYGDAPDTGAGTGIGNYQTTLSDSGASHGIINTLKIGTNAPDADNGTLQNANADADDTKDIDDEDGVTFPTALTAANTSYSATVNVTNTTGSNTYLVGWIDFNKDGVFQSTEGVAQTIANNASPQNVTLNWASLSGLTAGNTYARFRLSDSNTLTTSTSTGAVGNGEVEDYPVTITNIDYGDAPDGSAGTATGNYKTTNSDGGASHTIINTLKLGTNAPDADNGTLQNANADADDTNNIDDEDGVTFPTALTTTNTSYSATVNVTNTTGSNTYLVGWIDFNKDGVFQSTEGVAQTIANNASPQNVTLNWASLSGLTAGNTYARFRLSDSNTLTTSTSTGAVSNGEVEDYLVSIITPLDYGDAPDTYGTDTTANNSSGDPVGASHVINNNIYLGSVIPDAEANASTPLDGTGDDVTGIDDEDGVTSFPSIRPTTTTYSVDVKVTNNTGSTANLIGWIDFNRDGKFQATEAQTTTVATATTGGTKTLTWSSLSPTVGVTYARFRLTTDVSITTSTPGGAATNGEVEDYQLTIASNPPKLLLSKRITAIKSLGTTTNFTTVFTPGSIPSDTTATDSSWPAAYLQGGGVSDSNPNPADPVDAFRLRPGDEVEYTIYFVNAGDSTAQNVKICDLVPSNQAFLTNAFSGVSPATGGLANQQRGIAASINIPPATNHVLQSYTNVSDGDTAEFYAPNLTVPISCSGTNTNGAVVIRLGDIPKSTGSGVPENSYGFFRFQAKVN